MSVAENISARRPFLASLSSRSGRDGSDNCRKGDNDVAGAHLGRGIVLGLYNCDFWMTGKLKENGRTDAGQ